MSLFSVNGFSIGLFPMAFSLFTISHELFQGADPGIHFGGPNQVLQLKLRTKHGPRVRSAQKLRAKPELKVQSA